jgi:hypothetical protein
MTETQCPNGHLSSETDYCDVCGARLGPPASPDTQPQATAPPASSPESTHPTGSLPCPRCGTINTRSDKFCEGCGLNFASPRPAPGEPAGTTSDWVAIVTADREYYERTDAGDIEFPVDCPERRVPLIATQVTIGRRSGSRPITPDIDLAGPPEDAGVSHEHATLARDPDGNWLLTDRGSTNGTFHNDNETPLPPGEPIALVDGDCIHLGAWTTITLAYTGPPAAAA